MEGEDMTGRLVYLPVEMEEYLHMRAARTRTRKARVIREAVEAFIEADGDRLVTYPKVIPYPHVFFMRLDPEQWARINLEARALGESMNEVIRLALAYQARGEGEAWAIKQEGTDD